MSNRIDFAEVKAKVSIIDALARLQIQNLTAKDDQLRGACPLCKHTDQRAFVVTPSKGTWYCFREKLGGDVIRLVARFNSYDDRAAAQWLVAAADNGSAPAEPDASRKSGDYNPDEYTQRLDPSHEALSGLGIAPETFILFKAGYAKKGLLQGRLAFAWHDNSGVVQCHIGMALDGSLPRYKLPQGSPQPYWFNAHTLEEGDEPVRILTDVLDVMRAVENGCVNVICPIAPVNELSLAALIPILKHKKLTIEF